MVTETSLRWLPPPAKFLQTSGELSHAPVLQGMDSRVMGGHASPKGAAERLRKKSEPLAGQVPTAPCRPEKIPSYRPTIFMLFILSAITA